MGQGRYVAVVYGVVLDDSLEAKLQDADGEWLWESVPYKKESPDAGNESRPDYVGFRVAASDAMHDVEFHDVGTCPLSELPQRLEKHLARPKKLWGAFAEWALSQGVALPKPSLLFVADYD